MIDLETLGIKDVIKASPSELGSYVRLLREDSDFKAYAKFRLLYMQGQISELAAAIEAYEAQLSRQGQGLTPGLLLGKLRLKIRKTEGFNEILNDLMQIKNTSSPWQGECTVLLAMAFETVGDDKAAKAHYDTAYSLFVAEGLLGKAATALHNSIAAESRLVPDRRFLYDYNHAYQFALTAGELGTAGAALTNLSHEYQKMGALRAALRVVNRAIVLLAEHHFGSYQYFHGICHRCHLLIELDQIDNARADYEEASASELPEIKFALNILAQYFAPRGIEAAAIDKKEQYPSSPWADRQAEVSHSETLLGPKTLSDTENKLIEFLLSKPRDKSELLDFMYPDTTSYFDRENRLKQALHRLRKKKPGVVVYQDGSYSIECSIGG